MMKTREDGNLYFVTGKSRSGKSAWVKEMLAAFDRILIFDIKHEYSEKMGFVQVHELDHLLEILMATNGAGKIAYQPTNPAKEFGLWAKMALTWCKVAPCAIVAEELADVTTPAKAPDGWGQVSRQGMGFGAEIFAITQRPSESDKTALGNATLIHCCQMVRDADRRYMAAEMDAPLEMVNGLQFPYFIEKDLKTGELVKDKLEFKK